MEQITLRVSESTKESLQDEADEQEQTLSDYMRDLIAERNEDTVPQDEHDRLQSKHERLQDEHERVRAEVERVRDEKRQILAQREENQQLRRYVEHEQELQTKRHNASVVQRAKWFVFGGSEGE